MALSMKLVSASVCRIVVLLVVLIGLPGTGLARLTLTPSLLLLEEYESNIFLEPPGREVEDFVTTIMPGIQLVSDSKTLQADLDYRLQFRWYLDDSGRDQTSLRDVQRLQLNATLYPERDLSLRLSDIYQPVVIDERRPTSEANPFVNKVNRNLLEINPEYRLRRFKRFEPGLSYRYRNLYYAGGEGDDAESHRLDGDVVYRQSAHLRLLARYGVESFSSDDANDYDRQDLTVGFEAEPGPALSLAVEVGQGWVEPERAESSSALLVDSWLKLQLSPKLAARFDYRRQFQDSVTNGLVEDQYAAGSLSYASPRSSAALTLFAGLADYQELVREDRSAGLRLSFELSPWRRVALGAAGYRTWFGFEAAGGFVEDVIRSGADGWITCRLRRLTLRTGYRFEENESELDLNDYRNHVAYLEASLRF